MQVNNVSNPGIDPRTTGQSAVARANQNRPEQAVFNQTAQLNRALSDSPEVRSEEVARAKELISSLKYPPTELIGRLSRLLAISQRDSDS